MSPDHRYYERRLLGQVLVASNWSIYSRNVGYTGIFFHFPIGRLVRLFPSESVRLPLSFFLSLRIPYR